MRRISKIYYSLIVGLFLLMAHSFWGCEKSGSGTMFYFDSLPPNNNVKSFKSYDEVYAYFNELSLKDKNAMIRRLKNEHPLVDSLKKLENEMIKNTFEDMLPGQFDTAK